MQIRVFKKESIKSDQKENAISIIQDSAESINKRLIKELSLKNSDFTISYTIYGLWIDFNKNDSYGIKVFYDADNNKIIVRSMQDHDTMKQLELEVLSHPARIASNITQIITQDGVI